MKTGISAMNQVLNIEDLPQIEKVFEIVQNRRIREMID